MIFSYRYIDIELNYSLLKLKKKHIPTALRWVLNESKINTIKQDRKPSCTKN